jgi:hypothetical protein
MAYNYFVTSVNDLVRNMESAANLVLDALTDARRAASPHVEVERPVELPAPAGAR